MKNENRVDLTINETICVISLSGEVTTFSETDISQAYQTAIDKNIIRILFNFKDVMYINSAGIAILISLVTESLKNGIKLSICGLTPHFNKIFKMVGLTQYAEIFENDEKAIIALTQSA